MSQLLEQMTLPRQAPASIWCGRSWEGLVDRRCTAFTHALALAGATEQNCNRVVSEFLEFFDEVGVGLMRDEEEWVLASLRPTPGVVLKALEEHIAISSLVEALIYEVQAGCVDQRVVHQLGELLESHLLSEEEDIHPLVTRRRLLSAAT